LEVNLKIANENALHLDCCCFPPIGQGIIYKSGFEKKQTICISTFWEGYFISSPGEEMYTMNSNVFSIDSNVVVSEKNH
jgi:N-dimethylarginine dimethylaminohydrolase